MFLFSKDIKSTRSVFPPFSKFAVPVWSARRLASNLTYSSSSSSIILNDIPSGNVMSAWKAVTSLFFSKAKVRSYSFVGVMLNGCAVRFISVGTKASL